jgi:hypothetical protein
MTREIYIFHQGQIKLKQQADEMNISAKGPYVISDTPGYLSPLGTGWIEGKSARREDLKRSGCREVEPSEFSRSRKY